MNTSASVQTFDGLGPKGCSPPRGGLPLIGSPRLDSRPPSRHSHSGVTGACHPPPSILAELGCRVHLLERGPQIPAHEDEDVASAIDGAFAERGITVTTGIEGSEGIIRHAATLTRRYGKDGPDHAVACDAVVVSLGWVPNADAPGPEAAGP